MKKALFILLTILVVSILLISCNPKTRYTAEEWEEKQNEITQTNSDSVTVKENTEEKSKVSDFNRELEKFSEYSQKVHSVIAEYEENINKLKDKQMNQAKGRENEPAREEDKVIYELIRDEYNEYFNEYSLITPPVCANNYHIIYLEYLKECKLLASWIVNNMFNTNYNLTEADNIAANIDLAYAKSMNELKQLMESFNEEAKKLCLPEPYPDS